MAHMYALFIFCGIVYIYIYTYIYILVAYLFGPNKCQSCLGETTLVFSRAGEMRSSVVEGCQLQPCHDVCCFCCPVIKAGFGKRPILGIFDITFKVTFHDLLEIISP